jgi:hypothetical protein
MVRPTSGQGRLRCALGLAQFGAGARQAAATSSWRRDLVAPAARSALGSLFADTRSCPRAWCSSVAEPLAMRASR